MSSPYRTLDRAALRAETARLAFGADALLRDAFGLEVELLPVAPGGAGRAWTRVDPRAPLGDGRTLRELVGEAARRHEAHVVSEGERDLGARPPLERGAFRFGEGGQLSFASGACAKPAEAYGRCVSALGELEQRLLTHGVRLIGMGADPWSGVEDVPRFDASVSATCVELAQPTPEARAHRRLAAGVRVCVGFGGPVLGPERLSAGLALADAAEAAFAFSPLDRGAVSGLGGLRARRRRGADPLRTQAAPRGPALDEWVEHGLDARVLVVRAAEQWFPQARTLSFREWMERGFRGLYPELGDWRAHLETLDLGVRAAGWIEIDVHDSQARPFWGVPLVLWSALLCDNAALARAAALAPGSPPERARAMFALAADGLLRAPAGWHSPEMLAAFVEFAQRFVFAGRTPSDELLAFLSRRRSFGPAEYAELAGRWADAAGVARAG